MACATLDVSWYPTQGTHAAIYRKRDGPISGQYSDFYDYNSQLHDAMYATKRMREEGDSNFLSTSRAFLTHLSSEVVSSHILEAFHRTMFDWHVRTFNIVDDEYPLHADEIAYVQE